MRFARIYLDHLAVPLAFFNGAVFLTGMLSHSEATVWLSILSGLGVPIIAKLICAFGIPKPV